MRLAVTSRLSPSEMFPPRLRRLPFENEDHRLGDRGNPELRGDDHVPMIYSDNADEVVVATRYLRIPHEASQ